MAMELCQAGYVERDIQKKKDAAFLIFLWAGLYSAKQPIILIAI